MNNDILLSICILSYNQVHEVQRALNSLAPQMTDEVEVVIRDDSTNEDTKILVERFQSVFPIKYFHGKKEGIDKTILFLTKEALGRYVWWMGDDEVTPAGVAAVLDVIKRNDEINFVWANYRLANSTTLAIDLQESRYFSSRDELLVLGGTGLGFISATVFKRELALTGISRAEKYVGSTFVNLYLVLHVISQPGKYFYLRGPVVICHPATTEEIKEVVVKDDGRIKNDAFEVFGINFAKIVREFSNRFSSCAIRRTLKKSFGQTWRGVLVAFVGGWDTPHGKRIRMLKHFWMFPESWAAFVLFFLPKIILSPLYDLYKFLFRRNRVSSDGRA